LELIGGAFTAASFPPLALCQHFISSTIGNFV
jgi:hypothetical protein